MSDSRQDPMRELVEDYVLGVLDGGVLSRFEERLETDGALAAEVAAARDALAALAFSAPVLPDPALKERLMARIAPAETAPKSVSSSEFVERRIRSRDRRRRTTWISLGVAIAALLALVVKLKVDLHSAAADLEVATALASSRELTLAERDSLIVRLIDPSTETVTLAATGVARPAVKAYIDRGRRMMSLSAASLDAVPHGQTYQLWFIVGGKPVPSVTFKPGADGRAFIDRVSIPAGAVAATAITKEPDGGSTTPTMPILFMGKVATE